MNNNKVNIAGQLKGTGWLPPRPDLRDYSEEHEKIRGIFSAQGSELRAQGNVAQGAERRAQGKSLYPVTSNKQPATSNKQQAPPEGKVDLREFCSPIEDQGSIGSCTAHAAAGIVEYYERRAFSRHIEASRLFLYKTTRNLMQTTGDTGGWIRCTMGALVLCGIPDEKYWPYDVVKFDKEPPAFVYSVANNYHAVKYFRHEGGREQGARGREQGAGSKGQAGSNAPSALRPLPPAPASAEVLGSVKKYLNAGIPAMFGFWGFGSFDKSDVKGGIPYPADNESAQWGHAIAAFGYDDKKKIKNLTNNKTTTGALLIRNSWGEGWGEQGYGWLPYEYVVNELATDFWSLISLDWVDSGMFGV